MLVTFCLARRKNAWEKAKRWRTIQESYMYSGVGSASLQCSQARFLTITFSFRTTPPFLVLSVFMSLHYSPLFLDCKCRHKTKGPLLLIRQQNVRASTCFVVSISAGVQAFWVFSLGRWLGVPAAFISAIPWGLLWPPVSTCPAPPLSWQFNWLLPNCWLFLCSI